jgi:hypothetical protein
VAPQILKTIRDGQKRQERVREGEEAQENGKREIGEG